MAYTTIKTTEDEKKKKQQAAAANINGTNMTTKQTTAQTVTPNTASKSTNQYAQYDYDPNTDQAYLNQLAKLQTAQQNRPTYSATYDDQLHSLYDQIVNRDKFRYNAAEDPMWQNYLEQYTTKGKMAMMDTMGQAAALTGGYGSSYGQQVGQQTYQGYLQEANQAIPEFYGMALDAYTREGDAMAQQYGMLGDLKADEYSRYMDAVNQYWQDVNYQQGLADQAYDRGYNEYLQSQQMGYAREQDAYQKQQDAYNKLSSLIAAGYTPTAEDLAASGMTKAQADALARYYAGLNAGSGGSGSGGSSGGSKKKTPKNNNDGGDPLTYDDYNRQAAAAAIDGNADTMFDKLQEGVNAGALTEAQAVSLYNQYEPKATAAKQQKTAGSTTLKLTSTQATSKFVDGMKNKGWSKSKAESELKSYVSNGILTQAQANALRDKYINGVVKTISKVKR